MIFKRPPPNGRYLPAGGTVKGITIRFGDTTYAMIRREASLEGVSISAYTREAALMRAAIQMARRGEYMERDQTGLTEAARTFLELERQTRLQRN